MKRLLKTVLMIFIVLQVLASLTFAQEVTLQWDANTPEPDGYRVFGRSEEGAYDYSNPIVCDGLTTGEIPPGATTCIIKLPALNAPVPVAPEITASQWIRADSAVKLTWKQPEQESNTVNYYYVVRAFVVDDESGDSNEVKYVHEQGPDIAHWTVYYSMTSGGPYTKLGDVEDTGQSEVSIIDPITDAPIGVITTVYFTVIAHTPSEDVYSPNANEVTVVIDRRTATPPVNLRFLSALIPVE